MTSASSQPRKRGAGVSGQFDTIDHAEASAVSLNGPAAAVLSDEELFRRDREVAELHPNEDGSYAEHPADTLREVYADELRKIRAREQERDPLFEHEELGPFYAQKTAELEYLTGERDDLLRR